MKRIESQTPPRPRAVSEAEGRYHAAKARFLAAQQEKMEAEDEFLAARAAMRGGLKTPRATFGRAAESRPSESPAAWAGA